MSFDVDSKVDVVSSYADDRFADIRRVKLPLARGIGTTAFSVTVVDANVAEVVLGIITANPSTRDHGTVVHAADRQPLVMNTIGKRIWGSISTEASCLINLSSYCSKKASTQDHADVHLDILRKRTNSLILALACVGERLKLAAEAVEDGIFDDSPTIDNTSVEF
ncbi:hypothetical protein ACH5RR_015648 [Cinchona calisaya]|uniref:Uncharacterized protein n=1 Tax=Cinchona calisaya TaxID=153742 RepID=A0ABD2ZUL6_9GENT